LQLRFPIRPLLEDSVEGSRVPLQAQKTDFYAEVLQQANVWKVAAALEYYVHLNKIEVVAIKQK
jgi:hypothetical protein